MTLIRPVTDFAELQRCVDLQHEVWGGDPTELVPASILWAAIRAGGLVAGAFEASALGGAAPHPVDHLVGFVFGITGFVDGRPLHWSDMLAVHPRRRSTGIGQALKRFQRDTLLARGVTEVNWTFDPLEARNAWLNFARLGVTSREYLVDAYGRTSSPLHAGLSTDRLVVRWLLDSPRVRSRMEGAEPPAFDGVASLPVINPGDQAKLGLREPRLLVRIPSDIQAIKQHDPDHAAQWRATTREIFATYFDLGYEALEVLRGDAEFSYYLLAAVE